MSPSLFPRVNGYGVVERSEPRSKGRAAKGPDDNICLVWHAFHLPGGLRIPSPRPVRWPKEICAIPHFKDQVREAQNVSITHQGHRRCPAEEGFAHGGS